MSAVWLSLLSLILSSGKIDNNHLSSIIARPLRNAFLETVASCKVKKMTARALLLAQCCCISIEALLEIMMFTCRVSEKGNIGIILGTLKEQNIQ